jgi:hypothetical protein
MSRVKADMPQPSSDYVHIDTLLQQAHGKRMSKYMR